jgi:hypothetical protein
VRNLHGERVDNFGHFQPFGQKPHPSVDFTESLLAVKIVTIFGAITVPRRPGNCPGDLWTLLIPQLLQFRSEALCSSWSYVVLTAGNTGRLFYRVILSLVVVSLSYECLTHAVAAS